MGLGQTPPSSCSHPAVPIPVVPRCPHPKGPHLKGPQVSLSRISQSRCPHLRCPHWNVVSPSHMSLYTYLHLMCPQVSLSQVSPHSYLHPGAPITELPRHPPSCLPRHMRVHEAIDNGVIDSGTLGEEGRDGDEAPPASITHWPQWVFSSEGLCLQEKPICLDPGSW